MTAVVERLAAVSVSQPIVYPNGDRTQFTDLTFRCRYVSGDAHVADDESLEVGWFAVDDLPEMDLASRRRILRAVADEPEAVLDLDPA